MALGAIYVLAMQSQADGMKLTLAFAGLVMVLVFVQLSQASASVRRTYTVHRYDTVWTIANRFYPGTITADTVDRIEKANHLRDPLIVPGQRLLLP